MELKPETGAKERGLYQRLLKATLVTCAAAVVLHAVNCSRALLRWQPGYVHWPLLLLFVLSFAVAITLTGLLLLTAFQRPPTDWRSSAQRRAGLKLLGIVGAVLPLAFLVTVVLGMSALTKWLNAKSRR